MTFGMTLNRRRLIAAAGASLALPFAQAKEAERLRINLIPVQDVAPVYAGIKHGFFQQEGVEPTLTPSTGGAAGIPGLLGGAFDVIYGNNVSALLALSRGLDVRILAAGTVFVPTSAGILARKELGLKPGKSFEGKSVAVNTKANAVWLYAYSWIRENGGDPTKVNFREVPFPQMTDAVRQQQVDAAFVIDPFFTRASQDASLEVIGHPYAIQPNVQVGLYLCTGKALQEKPAIIAGFLGGLRRANDWYDAHRTSPEVMELIADYTKLPVEIVASIKRGPAVRAVNVDELRKTMQRMQDAQLLSAPVDLSKAVFRA